jgi:hypothetical protein
VSNVLNEHKKQQVLALGRLGWPLRQIERQTGVRRETAAGYLRAAGIPLRPPRGWGRQSPTTAANETPPDPKASAKPANGVTPDLTAGSKPANEVTPDLDLISKPANGVTPDSEAPSADLPEPHPADRSPTASACEPYRELIELALARGRNAKAIWQDLVDDHGFSGDYQSVKRFVRKLRGSASPPARAVILTAPGEEAQVDYGSGPMVRDPHSGKYRRTRLFVLTLGYSRKCVRLLSFRSSSRIWAELHEKAFRRLGGTTRLWRAHHKRVYVKDRIMRRKCAQGQFCGSGVRGTFA